MNLKLNLTVQDILQLPDFKDAKVVTDSTGLNRIVKCAHILEITQGGHLVNGNDIIFSTGIGWKNTEDTLSFLQQLIDKNVSALCVQLGYQYNEIPEEMIQLANEHCFPIIVFLKEVRFIDILYSLHAIFINQDYKIFLELEKFSIELNSILLAPHDLKDILYFCQKYLDVNVVFIPTQGENYFVPSLSSDEQSKILALIKEAKNNSQHNIAYKDVTINNNNLACLGFYSNTRNITKFEILALEKCTLALAQYLLRTLYIKEKDRNNEEWILHWLNGLLPEPKINQYLKQLDPSLKPSCCVICLATLDLSSSIEFSTDFMLNITFIARLVFEQQGFYLLKYFDNNQIIYILIDKKEQQTCKNRVKNALKQLQDIMQSRSIRLHNIDLIFSVGKIFSELNKLNNSLKTARETLSIQQKKANKKVLFYDDLHVYRLMLSIEKSGDLNELIMDYLEPIIKYDQQNNSKLLQTLKAFFECNCNKQETAQRLFIVRQSLYHRIQKIEELLGTSFMLPEKRIMIEVALAAYEYLNLQNSTLPEPK